MDALDDGLLSVGVNRCEGIDAPISAQVQALPSKRGEQFQVLENELAVRRGLPELAEHGDVCLVEAPESIELGVALWATFAHA